MKLSTETTRPRDRQQRRAWWRAHVQAQLASGQTQIAYCGTYGRNLRGLRRWMRMFTVGDARSRVRELVEGPEARLGLVPVVVRSAEVGRQAADRGAEWIDLQLTLASGLSMSLRVGSVAVVAELVRELSGPAC